MTKSQTIAWSPFSDKHKTYIRRALANKMNVAEGAIRSGKTIDHCIIAAAYLEICPDKIHLASGSSMPNAKLNIGACNGFGLENLFRGRCKWGKYKGNEALFLQTKTGEKIVIFAGGGKADSYKKILGNSYGLWIATEINEHYDSDDSRESFIKVAFGRQAAAVKPLILWDLNPCSPKHAIYEQYIDKYKEGFLGGYQYEHFTMDDNLSIGEARKAEIKSQYDIGSVWYRRDILGERCVAEGLIYERFANDEDAYFIDDVPRDTRRRHILKKINIGVDFGGNGSNHAFVATGFDEGWENVYVLASRSIPARGIDADALTRKFLDFADGIKKKYGFVNSVYADSAEQVLINTLRRTDYNVNNSIKNEIVDRIRCENLLLATNRIKLIRSENAALAEGLRYAVWKPEEQDDIRLDDGTSDIDVLDAFEYSFEGYISRIIRK